MPVTSAASAIKAGTVAHFANNTAPAGWLKCNGATVSRTTYGALFLAIGTTYGAGDGSTTFAVPDLRGEFVRGLDDGRGVDSGRGIGTSQASQNESHAHTASTDAQGSHAHALTLQNTTGAGGNPGAKWSALTSVTATNTANTDPAGSHAHNVTVDANGGGEARPRNLAMLACIKF